MEDRDQPFLIAKPAEDGNVSKVASQMEVANSVAFQNIDEQYYAGRLTSTEMAMFKARFIRLHQALKKSRDSEYKLHQLAKYCISMVEHQEMELSKAEQFPENAITEPLVMRSQILSTYNNAMETEERVETLIYEEGLLREERKLLKRDFSRLPTAELEALGEDVDIFAEMERRVKNLQNQCQEHWMEIDMLKMDGKRTREQLRSATDTLEDVRQEHSEVQLRLNRVKADWVLASALPGQYIKETEKARKYKSDFEKEISALSLDYAKLIAQKEKLEAQLLALITENESCRAAAADGKQQTGRNKELTEEAVNRYNSWNDLEMASRMDKAKLLQRIETCFQEKKELAEIQTKIKWEKDNLLKSLKKSTMQLEVLTESVKNIQTIYDKVRARYAVTPKYDTTLGARKDKLTDLVRTLQQDISEEAKRTASEQVHVNQAVVLTERRLGFLEHLRAESMELLRLATGLTDDLAKSVCEFNSSWKKYSRLSEDCKQKMALIQNQMETLKTLEAQMNEVSRKYTEVKMERNKCVSLLQVAIRVSTDTRERLRQQANESEILLTLAQKRENDLLNMRKTIMNLICQRDHKRHEYCKMAAVTAMQDAKREQMRQAIARLNLMFNQAESSIIAMKKACERNARIRNERAILLIERNQEVYLLQEREKAQDTAMAAAKMALRGLEDEYACSQLYLDQVKRFVHLVKEQVPHKNRLEGTVRGLIQQLIGLRARKAQLVSWFEDPDRVGRLRLLGGVDPSQSELWVILGKLEKRLSIKEEDLSEKNLIYEAVCRLVDALRVKTDASRNDTLLLALQVNGVQSKLFQLRRKMETRFAELIISNSERDRLVKKVSQLEKNLDICTIRSLSGMPPNRQIAREYELEARRKKVREDYKREKMRSPRKILPMRRPIKLPAIRQLADQSIKSPKAADISFGLNEGTQ